MFICLSQGVNAKVSQPFLFIMVYVRIFYDRILCSCTMSKDLPEIGFDHDFHSDVIRYNDVSVFKRFASMMWIFISI